jgi:putative oxidoreductase
MLDQRTAPYGILLLRLALGAFFWAHLYLKFFLYPGGFHQWWDNFAINGYYWFVPWYP